MMSQTATEAKLSANYVDNYFDYVENLPNDCQRQLSRLREIDINFTECLHDAEVYLSAIENPSTNERRRAKCVQLLQTALAAARELGDDKLEVVQVLQDLIDKKNRSLEDDQKKLQAFLNKPPKGAPKQTTPPKETPRVAEKEAPQPSTAKSSSPASPLPERSVEKEKEKGDKDKGGERWSKRARRSRNNAGTTTDGADSSERDSEKPTQSTHKKGVGKKKKRKTRQSTQRSETPPDEPDTIDPDEPRYCLCDQISFGEMILCDNDLCPIEWFHFSCVSLTTKPKGKWFCPKCRGDRPNIMKPKGQFLKELEKYNKEKEDKD